MQLDIPCILFAGGKSSRMGEDKALLPFGGYTTLSEYQYRRLENLFCDVYISTKDPQKFPFQAKFICDTSDIYAPTSGFVSVYRTLRVERFFVLGVDMPFVDAAIFETLFRSDMQKRDATLPLSPNGIESLCGIYHRSLEPHFEQMLQNDDHRLRSLIERVDVGLVPFATKEAFFNLNRPHEYQKAKELYDIIV